MRSLRESDHILANVRNAQAQVPTWADLLDRLTGRQAATVRTVPPCLRKRIEVEENENERTHDNDIRRKAGVERAT